MSCLRRRAACGLSLLLLLPACAGDPVFEHGEWHSARTGFRIGVPAAVQAAEIGVPAAVQAADAGPGSDGWERFDLEGAVLAYRRGKRETMSVQARCGRPVTSPALMARHLVIGIPERTLREGGPREVAGRPAWLQTFDARLEGRTVRIKTLTLVAGACAYDLLLVAEGDFAPAERSFDAWVESFALTRAEPAGAAP
jgi:hypothetical protein